MYALNSSLFIDLVETGAMEHQPDQTLLTCQDNFRALCEVREGTGCTAAGLAKNIDASQETSI